MAFLGDIGRTFFGGASTGDVVGSIVTRTTGNPLLGQIAGNVGQVVAEDISRQPKQVETTQTQTVQSSMGSYGGYPIAAAEYDPIGRQDYGGIMPATYTPPAFPMGQQMTGGFQQANVLKFAPTVGGAVAGFVGETIFDFFTGTEKKLIITRKLRRDTEKLMELLNNNMDEVARVLTDTKKKAFDSGTVLKILMHKFTNQGPYVTKAAVRKTRKTVRKLESLKRLHAEVCGTPTRARRAPARRRTSAMAKASC